MILTCFCAAGGLFILWFRNPNIFGNTSVRGASKAQIKKLKEIKYDPNGNDFQIDESDANCAICLSPYEHKENIRILPCYHHFHSECVDQWLTKNKSCPFCKRDIESEYMKRGKNGDEADQDIEEGLEIVIDQ